MNLIGVDPGNHDSDQSNKDVPDNGEFCSRHHGMRQPPSLQPATATAAIAITAIAVAVRIYNYI